MSIQICLLETGETIIGDIREAIDQEKNESIGYIVDHPFIIEHSYDTVVALDNDVIDNLEDKSTISFKRWAPLSKNYQFRYTYNFVRVIYEPHQSLVKTYIDLIQRWQEQFTEEIVVDKHKSNYTIYNDEINEIAENQSDESVVLNGEKL